MPDSDLELLKKLKIQIQDGFNRRNKEHIRSVFDTHKSDMVITAASLCAALKDLGINVTEVEIDELLKSSDTNDDGGLDFDEFSTLVSRSSSGLEFLRSLPLAELVWDGLPKEQGCAGENQLRHLSKISPKDLEVSIQAITEGLAKLLHENVAALKKAYDLLDSKAEANDTASAKFEMIKMSVGTIKDFHEGIAPRIGDAQNLFSILSNC